MPRVAPSSPVSDRPWWLAPVPILFGIVILLASAAVFLQDVIFPPKPVDPRTNVVLPGGGTFCDPPVQSPGLPVSGK